MARLRLRLDLDSGAYIGPGKVELLERVRDSGSISAAGRGMKMSYRRAWQLVDSLNHMFDRPVLEAHPGGSGGGGAQLTDFGHRVIALYRDVERKAEAAAAPSLTELMDHLQQKSEPES